ncbi:hypothetical protein [Pararhizobium sp. IMCC21322]|uniref:hypothetical protein n=1 Tax=Pararhizobium sp. IMCC21322 TaxID=3067903 RepID=UPI0027421633|nr:hypothetical protein [Pararhizobium sp. IMCC21322]
MKTPWHLWVIGVVTLLWNAVGAFDYVMTQTGNADYMAQFTPEQVAYFAGFPTWVNSSWAIAVWFAVAGSFLLLLRHRVAAPVLGLSLIAMIVTATHNFVMGDVQMQDVVGQGAIYFTIVLFAIALLLWVYSLKMRSNGVLR